jgi:hypothetical protein
MRLFLRRSQYLGAVALALLILVAGYRVATAQKESRPADAARQRAFKLTPEVPRVPPAPAHPLAAALKIAVDGYEHIRRDIRDYTCILIKQERIDGQLNDYEYLMAKVRHHREQDGRVLVPFSVYLRFLGPKRLKDREVLYVAGRNNGDLLARKGGTRMPYLKVWADPHSELAMRDNRYPITEFGIENMVMRLIEVAREDLNHGECEVKFFKNAKVEGRQCTGIQVVHPVPRAHFRYHMARIYIDDQLQIPLHFASYDWPRTQNEGPRLLEQYTFRRMRLNVGLTDADFDPNNPEYGFRKGRASPATVKASGSVAVDGSLRPQKTYTLPR